MSADISATPSSNRFGITVFKTWIPCLLCGSTREAPAFYQPRDHYLRMLGDPHPVVRYSVCKDCGLVYQNPRITREVEEALYSDGRYRGFRGVPPNDWLDRHFHFGGVEAKWIAAATGIVDGAGRRALEIGGGVGFGAAALRRAGWHAVALEPERELAAYGRSQYGLDVRAEFFSDSSFPGETFDLIFTYNVFEHLLDPLQVLRIARQKISPGGFVFINVPTFRRCYGKLTWKQFDSPHTVIFTHKTLGNMLARAGFAVFGYEYHVDGALRMLGTPSSTTDVLPYRERWLRVPWEIFMQGCAYFPARYVPSQIYQALRWGTTRLAPDWCAQSLERTKVAVKKSLGLHIWEQPRKLK